MTASAPALLVRSLIDYAGLFPPASKELPEAVRDYAVYLRRADADLLARFIIPVTRLHELAAHLSHFDDRFLLRLSVLAPPSAAIPDMADAVGYAAAAGDAFALSSAGRVRTETFETRVPEPHLDAAHGLDGALLLDLEGAAAAGSGRLVYVELPFTRRPEVSLDALAVLAMARSGGSTNLAAKIRCGGDHPADYPAPAVVARFIERCSSLAIPFKATAGLHHPIRAWHDAEQVWMHGFINVFMAGILACTRRVDTATLEAVIAETDPSAFVFSEEGARWRDLELSLDEVATTRRDFAHTFGSCSFDEPTDDLRALGWLPVHDVPHQV